MPKERGEDGQYRPTVTDEDVLGVLDAVAGPVVTSADVADGLEVTGQTARRRLDRLVTAGSLEKRKTAGRVVYWRPGEVTPAGDDESGQEQADESDPSTPDSREDTDEGAAEGLTWAEVPGDGS